RVFEIGRVFHPVDEPRPGALPEQPTMLAGLVSRAVAPAAPRANPPPAPLFALKAAPPPLARPVAREPLRLPPRRADPPGATPPPALFFELKAALSALAGAVAREPLGLVPGGVDHVWAHPARQATLTLGGRPIGAIAEVHPLVVHRLELRHGAAFFELDL